MCVRLRRRHSRTYSRARPAVKSRNDGCLVSSGDAHINALKHPPRLESERLRSWAPWKSGREGIEHLREAVWAHHPPTRDGPDRQVNHVIRLAGVAPAAFPGRRSVNWRTAPNQRDHGPEIALTAALVGSVHLASDAVDALVAHADAWAAPHLIDLGSGLPADEQRPPPSNGWW
jgi:hypothetical protein